MNVRVILRATSLGTFGELQFNRELLDATTYADGPDQQAEVFAQELEHIAATLRRMYPRVEVNE